MKNFAVFVGVSDTFIQKNINHTIEESMHELRPIVEKLVTEGYFYFCGTSKQTSIVLKRLQEA